MHYIYIDIVLHYYYHKLHYNYFITTIITALLHFIRPIIGIVLHLLHL